MAGSSIVGILKVLLTADTAQYSTAMAVASKQATAFSKEFNNIGKQMSNIGAAMTKTITLPLLAIGAGSVKAAADFESAFSNVAKTVDGVADKSGSLTTEGQKLAAVFRDMAKEIPATTTELTAIAALGGQMGVPIDQLAHFTKNVAALSVAVDGISAEDAAAGLAQIGNATGQGTSKISEFASTLVHLGNSSNATEGQILEFTKRLIGAGHSAGMTVPQVMAIGTAMADVGINAEAGGTAMSTVIAKIGKAVSTGSKDLSEFAKIAGVSAKEFADVWKRSPAEGLDLFIRGLSTLRDRGVDLNLTMGEIGAEGVRVASTLKLLAGAGDGVAKNLAIANDGYADGNKHLEEAGKKYNTFNNQLKVLFNQIRDVGITLGTALLPTMKSLIGILQSAIPIVDMLAKAFTTLPTWVQASVVGFAGLVAAMGPVLWVMGQVVTSAGAVIGAFKSQGVATKALDLVMKSSIGTSGALGMALKAVGSASAVAATAFVSWNLGKWIGEVTGLTNIIGYLSAKLGELVGLLPKGAAAQYTATVRAQEAASAAKNQAKAIDEATDATEGFVHINEFVGPVLDRNTNGMDDFAEASEEAKKKAEAFADSLKALGGADAMSGAKEVVKQLGALGGPLNVLPSKLQEMAARLREGAEAAMLMGRSDLANQYAKLADTLNPVIQFQQRYNVTIGEYVTLAPQAVGWTEDLTDQLNRLGGTVTTIGPVLENSMTLPWVGFASTVYASSPRIESAFDSIGDAVKNLGNTILQAVQGGGSVIGSIGSSIGQALGRDLAENLSGFLTRNLGKTLGDAFGAVLPGIGALLGPALSSLGSGLKKLFGIGVNDAVREANREIDKVRQKLIETHGPLEVLEQKANAVGLSFSQNWGHQGQAGLAAFNDLVDEFNKRWDDLQARREKLMSDADGMRGEIDGLIGKAREFGYEFNQAGDFVGVNFDTLRTKAQDFGVDINSLGPAFRQQDINAEAVKIIDAFTLMDKAGGDTGAILTGMKDEIGALVGRSIAMGTTIPANMRPWIQNLIDTKQLTDENGDAITDISEIKFGDPVATQFEDIAKSLKDVVDKLAEVLAKIAEIPTSRTFTIQPQWGDPGPQPNWGGSSDPSGGDPGHAVGTLGRWGSWFKNFGPSFDTALHGVEAVITPEQAPAFALDVLGSQLAGAGAGGGGVSMAGVEARLASIELLLQAQPRHISRAVREGNNMSGTRR